MALFKISKGNANGLDQQPWGNGYAWFTQDDGKFYIDYYNGDESDNPLQDSKKIRQPLNAYQADKLGENTIGSTTQPIYLNNGTPTAIDALSITPGDLPVYVSSSITDNPYIYVKTDLAFTSSDNTRTITGTMFVSGYDDTKKTPTIIPFKFLLRRSENHDPIKYVSVATYKDDTNALQDFSIIIDSNDIIYLKIKRVYRYSTYWINLRLGTSWDKNYAIDFSTTAPANIVTNAGRAFDLVPQADDILYITERKTGTNNHELNIATNIDLDTTTRRFSVIIYADYSYTQQTPAKIFGSGYYVGSTTSFNRSSYTDPYHILSSLTFYKINNLLYIQAIISGGTALYDNYKVYVSLVGDNPTQNRATAFLTELPSAVDPPSYSATLAEIPYASSALADESGNNIKANYGAALNLDGHTLSLLNKNGTAIGNAITLPDENTWKANSATSEGYVASGANQANKVWKTDASGVPAWRDDANTTSFTITANATDGLWNLTGTSGTNAVTYAVGAYSSQQSKASFDTSTTNPARSDRLNYNGYLYATKLYSGGAEVLTSHQSLANYKTKQTVINDSTGTSEETTATRFIYSISQNENGEISVKTRPLPTYNNYTLPLAASGTRGGIQIGYTTSGQNYAVQLNSSEKAYVNVPWTDYHVRQTNDASTNANYRLLLSNSANDTQEDEISRKNANLIYNPSLNKLSTGNMQLTGELDVTGNTNLNNVVYANGGIETTTLLVKGNSTFVNNVNFTSIPTTQTATAGDSSSKIATTEFVSTAISAGFAANDAMVFKGTIGNTSSPTNASCSSLPTSGYSAGWTYRVVTSGVYIANTYCEIGDLIIAVNDGPTSGNSIINTDWTIAQTNIDGALYKTNSTTYNGDKILISSGSAGLVKEGELTGSDGTLITYNNGNFDIQTLYTKEALSLKPSYTISDNATFLKFFEIPLDTGASNTITITMLYQNTYSVKDIGIFRAYIYPVNTASYSTAYWIVAPPNGAQDNLLSYSYELNETDNKYHFCLYIKKHSGATYDPVFYILNALNRGGSSIQIDTSCWKKEVFDDIPVENIQNYAIAGSPALLDLAYDVPFDKITDFNDVKAGTYLISNNSSMSQINHRPVSIFSGGRAIIFDGYSGSANGAFGHEFILGSQSGYLYHRAKTKNSGTNWDDNWYRIVQAEDTTSTIGSDSQPVYLDSSGMITALTKVGIAYGGTGAATAAEARTNLGLSNITNHQQVHEVTWDSTNKKITRSKNGTAGDVVQFVSDSNITLTAESGKLTIGHALSGVTAGTTSPNTDQTPDFNATFNIPTVTFDAAGHITSTGTTTVKIPAQTQLSKTDSGPGNAVTAITVSNHAITVTKGDTFVNLSSAQTISGTKTFSAIQKFTNTTDSSHSTDTAAAVSISGGLSVAKKVSAKEVRIDNNQTSKGVSMQYDATLEVLNFVFS